MLLIDTCDYKIDFVDNEGSTPHTHTTTSEIIQTFDNKGKVIINGKVYKMQKNGLYFIHGLATHFVLPDDINTYNHSLVVLNTSEIEHLCFNLNLIKEYNKVFTSNGGTFCELSNEDILYADNIFLQISKICENPGNGFTYAKMSSLFVSLLELGCKNKSSESYSDSKVSTILTYLNQNILTKLTLDDISRSIGISKFYMCRQFQDNMGITIGGYIKNRRISVAKQLLIETDMSISEISMHCCFSNSSFFAKVFSEEIGCTPTSYRAKYK